MLGVGCAARLQLAYQVDVRVASAWSRGVRDAAQARLRETVAGLIERISRADERDAEY